MCNELSFSFAEWACMCARISRCGRCGGFGRVGGLGFVLAIALLSTTCMIFRLYNRNGQILIKK